MSSNGTNETFKGYAIKDTSKYTEFELIDFKFVVFFILLSNLY